MKVIQKKLDAHAIVYKDGDVANSLFIVKSGQVLIYKKKGDAVQELVRIQPGQIFGELAFFAPRPRSSHAQATKETELVEIPFSEIKEDFNQLAPWVKLMLVSMSQQVIRLSQDLQEFKVFEGDPREGLVREFLQSLGHLLFLTQLESEGDSESKELSLDSIRRILNPVFKGNFPRFQKFLDVLDQEKFLHVSAEFITFTFAQIQTLREIFRFLSSQFEKKNWGLVWPEPKPHALVRSIVSLTDKYPAGSRGDSKMPVDELLVEVQKTEPKVAVGDVEGLLARGLSLSKESTDKGLMLSLNKPDMVLVLQVWNLIVTAEQKMAISDES